MSGPKRRWSSRKALRTACAFCPCLMFWTPSASSRTRPSATAGRPRASTSRSRRVRRPENGSTTSPSMGAAELSTSCSTSRAPILRALCPGWPIGSRRRNRRRSYGPYARRSRAPGQRGEDRAEPFTAPSPIPEHWPRVRKYLVEERALPAPYIDKLHQQGDCYADARRNAVFICRDAEGRAVGAELKGTIQRSDGTRFSGMTPGSAKDAGGFRIGSIAKAAVIYLVESAIDAISLAKLRATAGEKSFAIISTAGTTPNPRAWLAGIADKVKRVCAFDNDSVGDKAADGLRRHRFERLRPTGKDWNDDLKAARRAAGEGTTTKAVMDVLRRPDALAAARDHARG